MSHGPYPCGLLAFDIQGSGRCRDHVVSARMREGLYEIARSAIDEAGIEWDACHVEDRGDGIFAVTPGTAVKDLVDPLAGRIRARLDTYNRPTAKAARLRLRVAAHAGYVTFARHGDVRSVEGPPATHVFRIMDADAVRRLADVGGDLTLVVSDHYFSEVVRWKAGLPGREDFHPVWIKNKETQARVWVWTSSPVISLPQQAPHPVRTVYRPPAGLGEPEAPNGIRGM